MAPFFTGIAKNLGGYGFGKRIQSRNIPPEVTFLLLGGGGGGGGGGIPSDEIGGGGGAAAFVYGTMPVTLDQVYTITIGSGGGGGPFATSANIDSGYPGVIGSPSIFGDLISAGGGFGVGSTGNYQTYPGTGAGAPPTSPVRPFGGENGGSGGGGSNSGGGKPAPAPGGGTATGAAYSGSGQPGTTNDVISPPSGWGNPGGFGNPGGGGGGGAGEGGGNADGSSLPTNAPAHVGGDGLSISWIPPSYGTPGPSPGRWFAAGGGAGVYDPTQPASGPLAYLGGAGGGGTGGVSAPGTPGFSSPKVAAISATINTGSGGGGAARYLGGSNGSSGICAIRYPDSYEDASSVTGSGYEFIQTGGYKIYVFTSAGSIAF